MELGLTFPLQRFLGIKTPAWGTEPDRRFCWDLHVIDLQSAPDKQIRAPFRPVILPQKNGRLPFPGAISGNFLQKCVRIVLYVDFLMSPDLPDLSDVVWNPEKPVLLPGFLLILFIDDFYHTIHPFWATA